MTIRFTLNDYADLNNLKNLMRGKITRREDADGIWEETAKALQKKNVEMNWASSTAESKKVAGYTQLQVVLVDIIIICICALKRLGVDVERILEDKLTYNLQRND